MLGEGKSYADEMLAGSPLSPKAHMDNAKLIRTSLQATRQGLGLPGPLPDPWTGRLYQNANRLTHAQWLRDRGVQAFFAHLLFIDDPIEPTTANQWREAIETAASSSASPRPRCRGRCTSASRPAGTTT